MEHHFHWEAVALMTTFHEILKNGGICEIRVPDTEYIISTLNMTMEEKILMLYGGQDIGRGHAWNEEQDLSRKRHPEFFCHKYGWTKTNMTKCVNEIGFSVIEIADAYPNFIMRKNKRTL